MTAARRLTVLGMALAAALVAAAFIGTVSSQAYVSHVYAGGAVIEGPRYIAVDEATGDFYVSHFFEPTLISKFDADGNPATFEATGTTSIDLSTLGEGANSAPIAGLAVDNSGGPNDGTLYVARSGATPTVIARSGEFIASLGPSREGAEGKGEGEGCAVAVDGSGNIYASYTTDSFFGGGYIDKRHPGQWIPGASPEQRWPVSATMGGYFHKPGLHGERFCRMAIDATGALYISNNPAFGKAPLRKYSAAVFSLADPPFKVVDPESNSVAVDQTNNDMYSDHLNKVVRFNEAGEQLEVIGEGEFNEGSSAFSFDVGVDGANGTVYASDFFHEQVRIFKGVVTPDIEDVQVGAGQTSAALSAQIGTAGAGDVTGCEVEYATQAQFENNEYTSTPCVPDPSGTPFSGPQAVTGELSGLEKETKYHYRFAATNANGTHADVDRTFTTHNVADLTTEGVSGVTETDATLHGSFTGNGEPTTYWFEWGTGGYEHSTEIESAGSGTGHIEVSGQIVDELTTYLPQDGPYHYRVVAENGSGKTFGQDRTFHSKPPNPPTISGEASSGVGDTTATLTALVNPNGGPTVFGFEYGATSAYGTSTLLSSSIGEDRTDHAVEDAVSGLEPGTVYHYRAVAINFGGTSYGPDQAFVTTGGSTGPVPVPAGRPAPPREQTPKPKPKKCRRGFVKRHGKCVKRKKHPKHRHHRHHRRGSKHG